MGKQEMRMNSIMKTFDDLEHIPEACDIYFEIQEDEDLVIGGFVTKSKSGTKRFRTSIDEVQSQEKLLGLMTKNPDGKPQFINAAENFDNNVTKRAKRRKH